jgi:hypothetical protein
MVVSTPARAQAPSTTKVTAEALFEDARRLMADGKFADACPKFAASESLDPSPSTLLNLASCYERQGRNASAWATYREAASVANAWGRKDYLSSAERHAAGLEPGLARLTLNVAQPVDGLRIERDGVAVDQAEWGIAIPVDPGLHAVAASAAGHKPWSSSVSVADNGAQVTVTVPALDVAPVEVAPPAPTAAPVVVPAEPVEGDHRSTSSTQTAVGWIIAGVGVVGLAVGTGLAVSAKNKDKNSLSMCESPNTNLCSQTGLNERNEARSQGDVATLAFGLGAAAIVAGGVLWLTAPHGGSSGHGASLLIAPTLGGASLQGAW